MLNTVLPLLFGKIGAPELILIVAVVLILFGGRKIPELMRGMGRGIKEFKDAMNKDYNQIKDEIENAEEVKPEDEEKK